MGVGRAAPPARREEACNAQPRTSSTLHRATTPAQTPACIAAVNMHRSTVRKSSAPCAWRVKVRQAPRRAWRGAHRPQAMPTMPTPTGSGCLQAHANLNAWMFCFGVPCCLRCITVCSASAARLPACHHPLRWPGGHMRGQGRCLITCGSPRLEPSRRDKDSQANQTPGCARDTLCFRGEMNLRFRGPSGVSTLKGDGRQGCYHPAEQPGPPRVPGSGVGSGVICGLHPAAMPG